MKKTTKLQLKTNTVRVLQTPDLERVNGGDSLGCTAGAGCGGTSNPPKHTPGSGNPHNNGNGH